MSFKPKHARETPDGRRYADDADRWLREHGGEDQAKEDERRRARQRAAASRAGFRTRPSS